MTDVILALSQNPFARSLAQRAKLPIPLPEKLERQEGAEPGAAARGQDRVRRRQRRARPS